MSTLSRSAMTPKPREKTLTICVSTTDLTASVVMPCSAATSANAFVMSTPRSVASWTVRSSYFFWP